VSMHRNLPLSRPRFFLFALVLLCAALAGQAQDKPYFVTYSHDLEEPGELELETKTAAGNPDAGNGYSATAFELEYGVRAWWTAELYLDAQTTADDSSLFTGYRIENRFRPLMREHWINPVLYVEWEDTNAADKTMLEVVGHDGQADLSDPNDIARKEQKHEGELKLILSSNLKSWNISENFIAEKNLGHQPWEFGYSLGIARPLRSAGAAHECTFCAEKIMLGAEAYGGLGDTWSLTLRDTSQYLAPLVGWHLPRDMRVSFSPGWGATRTSLDHVFRFGFAMSFGQIGNRFRGQSGGIGDLH
jgi:hypothetical protein